MKLLWKNDIAVDTVLQVIQWAVSRTVSAFYKSKKGYRFSDTDAYIVCMWYVILNILMPSMPLFIICLSRSFTDAHCMTLFYCWSINRFKSVLEFNSDLEKWLQLHKPERLDYQSISVVIFFTWLKMVLGNKRIEIPLLCCFIIAVVFSRLFIAVKRQRIVVSLHR